MRRAPELKFEGKRPTVQPATVGSNILGIRANSRDKKMFANHIINKTNIFTDNNALHQQCQAIKLIPT